MIENLKNIHNLQSILEDAITSYDRYETGDTKFIQDHIDSIVKDSITYSNWVAEYQQYPVVKVDGIENYLSIPSSTIHLFVHNETNYSFDWHKDDVNVCLYVVKGKKTVHLESKVVELLEGDSLEIPKGHMHKVYSDKGTWALSIQI